MKAKKMQQIDLSRKKLRNFRSKTQRDDDRKYSNEIDHSQLLFHLRTNNKQEFQQKYRKIIILIATTIQLCNFM